MELGDFGGLFLWSMLSWSSEMMLFNLTGLNWCSVLVCLVHEDTLDLNFLVWYENFICVYGTVLSVIRLCDRSHTNFTIDFRISEAENVLLVLCNC